MLDVDVSYMILRWLCKKDSNRTHHDSLVGTTIGAADALAILCPENRDKLYITNVYMPEHHYAIMRKRQTTCPAAMSALGLTRGVRRKSKLMVDSRR